MVEGGLGGCGRFGDCGKISWISLVIGGF